MAASSTRPETFRWDERERQNSAYGAPTETLYTLRRCVGFSGRSRRTEYSPSTDNENEEKLGDGLETVLGFFDVISYFRDELPKWGNVCQYRPMLEATFLKFVGENATTHMTGLNRKRNGTVKYMEVPNKNVRDIMNGLAYTNPFCVPIGGDEQRTRKRECHPSRLCGDRKDRGRALLRDDSVRTGKRHNSKTRKSDTTNGPQQQGQVMLSQATMAASGSSVQAPNVLKPIPFCFLFTKTQ